MAEAGMGRFFRILFRHAEMAHDVSYRESAAGGHEIPDEVSHAVAEKFDAGKPQKAQRAACGLQQGKTDLVAASHAETPGISPTASSCSSFSRRALTRAMVDSSMSGTSFFPSSQAWPKRMVTPEKGRGT